MVIEKTACTGRTLQVRPGSNPEHTANRLRYGSAVSQLENDRFDPNEGDESERAYRRGWNCAVDKVLFAHREQRAFSAARLNELELDIKGAFARGHNAGLRHAVEVLRIERGLSELAHAPAIRTIEQPLVDISEAR